MDVISSFSGNISEILDESCVSVEEFAQSVEIAFSEVYRYLRKEYLPKLSNIIKIADRYGYSVDFLLGYAPYCENQTYKKTPPFDEQFKKLLKEKRVSRYRLSKDTGISVNRLDDWYHGIFTPSYEKAAILTKYFDCSFDYLLGREN